MTDKPASFKTAYDIRKLAYATYTNAWVRRVSVFIVASIPVLLYVWRFTITNRHGTFQGEDWDEFAQMYEAARITILHYQQFPWWNVWSIGGEPLFANPQFGLFSLQMPLVLLFGTVVGLHLSVAVYFFLGYWGMFRLLKRLGTNLPLRTLLSYIWILSGFPVWHLGGGHFTFAVYLLAPWVFLSLINVRRRWGWLWFALMISLIFNTAVHYLTIQVTIITAFLAAYELYRYWYRTRSSIREVIFPYLKACILIALLILPKVYYTLQFVHEFPRVNPVDDISLPISIFMAALTVRHSINPIDFFPAHWFWGEYADYFGFITLLLTFYMVGKTVIERKRPSRDVLIVVGMALAFLIYLGTFSKFSPWYLITHLPLLNQMRVPSRYIAWFVFGAIILLRKLPARNFIYILLIVSVLDAANANGGIINYVQPTYVPPATPTHSFQQYTYFDTHGVADVMNLNELRLLRATQSNYGEIYGYEPTLDMGEYWNPLTIRCGINNGCNFVMTHNATVAYWSPNKIILHRTASGPIALDMNPGRVWKVNGAQPFTHRRILEPGVPFTINDPSKTIVVSFSPHL